VIVPCLFDPSWAKAPAGFRCPVVRSQICRCCKENTLHLFVPKIGGSHAARLACHRLIIIVRLGSCTHGKNKVVARLIRAGKRAPAHFEVDFQASRDRNAIYAYLTAVYGLVAVWAAEGQEVDRARRALRSCRLEISDREDPFAAVIRCTADPEKADQRTRSKWSRVMRYAAVYKLDSEPLDLFIKRKGGINECAARFIRCLGRGTATKGVS
jgi:hypothetical protein